MTSFILLRDLPASPNLLLFFQQIGKLRQPWLRVHKNERPAQANEPNATEWKEEEENEKRKMKGASKEERHPIGCIRKLPMEAHVDQRNTWAGKNSRQLNIETIESVNDDVIN